MTHVQTVVGQFGSKPDTIWKCLWRGESDSKYGVMSDYFMAGMPHHCRIINAVEG